jgi:hypothetical protein
MQHRDGSPSTHSDRGGRLARRRAHAASGLSIVVALAIVAGALGSPSARSASTASRKQIAIHEQGTDNRLGQGTAGAVRGKFTIELAKTPFGPGGTTVIYATPSGTRQVNGQVQIPFGATDRLTSKNGTIDLAISGIHIDVNGKLHPSGTFIGPAAEYGTWKIRTATGIYQGWRGGGNWASVASGYRNRQPYSVEWDGYVVTP